MNKLELFLEKIVYVAFALCFAFVCLYVPGGWHKVETAQAGGSLCTTSLGLPCLSEPTGAVTAGNTGVTAGASVTTAAASVASAALDTSMFALDNVLDGIAWGLAKAVVSQMTASIVNWINSGFKGSPAFISDFSGFLLNVADKEIGAFLEELGGPFSFICSPFKLDVRMALAVTYDQAREGKTTSSCTLTGALKNIEQFIDGTEKFVDGGGWESWFKLTSQPTVYTPTGNILEAQAQASARIVNAKGQEIKLFEAGGGFLSSKVCEVVHGAGTKRENCFITTPGKVIQEALTFQTSTGARSLIEADEINEIVGALFGQIAKQVISGAAGLLGLSGNTGYSNSPVSFTDQLTNDSAGADPEQIRTLVDDAIDTELRYRSEALTFLPRLRALEADTSVDNDGLREDAGDAADDITRIIAEIDSNIVDLNLLLRDFDTLDAATSPTDKQKITQDISSEYFSLKTLHSEVEVDGKISYWEMLLR